MATALRIGSMIDVDTSLPDTVAQLRRYKEAGLDHAFASQIFGPDALTLLAAAGAQVPGIGLGTGVVPVYPRHPMMLAQQALTVQWATGNRLLLGIGLSHQVVVEGIWGMSYDRPARYMKEYLSSLMPLLQGETVKSTGRAGHHQRLRAPRDARRRGAAGPGRRPRPHHAQAGGHGRRRHRDLDDRHRDRRAATSRRPSPPRRRRPAARRPAVVVSLPVAVTDDLEAARERINEAFSIYPNLPSYKAMLDKEGAESRGRHRVRRGRGGRRRRGREAGRRRSDGLRGGHRG